MRAELVVDRVWLNALFADHPVHTETQRNVRVVLHQLGEGRTGVLPPGLDLARHFRRSQRQALALRGTGDGGGFLAGRRAAAAAGAAPAAADQRRAGKPERSDADPADQGPPPDASSTDLRSHLSSSLKMPLIYRTLLRTP